jgi:hypothetical protein
MARNGSKRKIDDVSQSLYYQVITACQPFPKDRNSQTGSQGQQCQVKGAQLVPPPTSYLLYKDLVPVARVDPAGQLGGFDIQSQCLLNEPVVRPLPACPAGEAVR